MAEAQQIYTRMVRLKSERAAETGANFYELDRRIQLLYDIYLEMRHTGQYLIHYPGRESEKAG